MAKYPEYEKWKNKFETTKDNNYMFINIATSGLPQKLYSEYNYKDLNMFSTCRIVQIVWYIYNNKKKLIEKSFYIKPNQFEIDEKSQKIHGISKDFAIEHGVELKFMLDTLLEDIINCNFIISHNINFDLNVLMSEIYRTKNNKDLHYILLYINKICTGEATKSILKLPTKFSVKEYKMPKLSELYKFYFNKEIPPYNIKTNLDCLVEIFFHCMEKYKLKHI